MAKIVLTPEQEKELAERERKGQFRGDALIEMGLAKRVVVDMEEFNAQKGNVKKGRPVDADKQRIMDLLKAAIEQDELCLVTDVSTREIKFRANGVDYTMALTKHKAK